VILYAITDGTAGKDEPRWIVGVKRILSRGVHFLQIRERDLSARRLADLTRSLLALPNPAGTKILVNDRADVAIACGAHGVHLRDGSVSPETFARPGFTVSVSCHGISDLNRTGGADLILLAPIFAPLSKTDARPSLGPEAVGEASHISRIPVLALGGITQKNAPACIAAGAAGIAGISYFAD
jgi:thiamine-phosphate pyrophosphorylase